MPATTEAPRSAADAAHELAREGKHVHLVSEGHSTCLKAACGPTAIPLPFTVQEQARLARLSLAFEVRLI
jgi:hypothetical protein